MNNRKEVAAIIKHEYDRETFVRGNYTVAIVYWQAFRGVGVSKRNPTDDMDVALGTRKALGRALSDLIEQVWDVRYEELRLAGWISPGIPGTIGSDGAGSRLAQWMMDCQNGLATSEDFGKDLTPIVTHNYFQVWKT
jgi:hypothetical protein